MTGLIEAFKAKLGKLMTDAKVSIEREAEETLRKYKQKLAEDRQRAAKDLENKNQEELAVEANKRKQKAGALQKMFVSRKASVEDKHNLNKSAIEKEHEIKMRLLPEPRLAESEKLKAELVRQEGLRGTKAKIAKELADLSSSLTKAQQQAAEQEAEKQIEAGKAQYEAAANAKIDSAEKELAEVKDSIRQSLTVAHTMKDTEKSVKQMEDSLAKKSAELESVQKKAEQAEVQCQELETELRGLQAAREEQVFAGEPEDPTGLQRDLEAKNAELESLRKEAVDLRKILAETAAKSAAEEEKKSPQIKALTEKLEEIKSILVGPGQRRTVGSLKAPAGGHSKQRQHEKGYYASERRVPKHKLREVAVFVQAEKANLLLNKKNALNDYKVAIKLLRNLDYSRQECGKELDHSRVSEPRQPMLDELRTNLDRQVQTLTAQARQIKYMKRVHVM